ncbi:MAG TPA: Ppx/GppA phosphatase family protein, partial [Zoogloea sp.]|nr:Ppx/GppA phosphatase family protein [Zoogloea sp.]
FVIGKSFQPIALESLYMGCVSFSLRHFPEGRVDRRGLRDAELAAQKEIQTISHAYREVGWEEAVGSSGSAKALVDILELNGLSDGGITRSGLERLRALMLRAGNVNSLQLEGLRPDRLPVLPGGFAIMWAVFEEFGLERMTFSEGALRLGVLYDLLGRYHHHDLRDATVAAFVERYGVDAAHARQVAETARAFLLQLDPGAADEENVDRRFLEWAAQLHEIGVSVAHSSYHKHSAYILGNADMPGFSRMDQGRLARMVLAHRGKLARVSALEPDSPEWRLILCLRLAAVVHRARDGRGVPPLRLRRDGRGHVVVADAEWLRNLPLTAAALDEEERQWQAIGLPMKVRLERASARSSAIT